MSDVSRTRRLLVVSAPLDEGGDRWSASAAQVWSTLRQIAASGTLDERGSTERAGTEDVTFEVAAALILEHGITALSEDPLEELLTCTLGDGSRLERTDGYWELAVPPKWKHVSCSIEGT